jgi:ABC-type branched-subunit amino acid transport system permease subunit
VWVLVLACLVVVTPRVRSPWGRVLRAIREDEDAASALGKPVYWYKLQSLAIGAAFGAIAGLLYAFEFQTFGPTDFAPVITFYAWLIILIAGAGRIWAVPVGALIFGLIFTGPTLLNFKPFTYLDAAQLAYFEMMVIGGLLIALMAWRPQGVFGRREEMVLE